MAQLVRELDGNSSMLREYQYGRDLVSMKAPSNVYYFHHDGLESIANLTSSTGTTMWTYAYNPFGDTRVETKNNNQAPANFIKFAGQYLDPSGLYHMRARQYDATSGRFLTVDPADPSLVDPYVGAYLYVRNNPIVRVDPSGRCFQFIPAGAQIGAAGGTVVEPGGGTLAGAFGGAAVGFVAFLGCSVVVIVVGGTILGGDTVSQSREDPTSITQTVPYTPPVQVNPPGEDPGGPIPPPWKWLVPPIILTLLSNLLFGQNVSEESPSSPHHPTSKRK